jgi:tetratricopeptide (TPR) repeat protein
MLSEPHHRFNSDSSSRPESRPVSSLRYLLLAMLGFSIVVVLTKTVPVANALQLGAELIRVEGRVYGQGGQFVSNARVKLESEEGDEVFETNVNDEGRYSFLVMRRGVYQLIATAEGYETSRQSVDLTRPATHAIVDITMTHQGTSVPGGDPPSLTDAEAPRKARKEYQEGMKALAANRIPEAKARFAKAVTEYPCYARAQTAEALGLISDHDLPGAETALKKAIKCDPGFTGAYLKLGELYNAEMRFRDGQVFLQEGLRREPGSWKFHYHLGVAYYGLGWYGKAEDEYRMSESLTPPAPPDVHVKLADVYSKQGSYDRAYAEMRAYLEADPNGRFAARVRTVMQEMRTLAAAHPSRPAAAAEPESKP